MAQLNITLDSEFLTGLFLESRDQALGKLLQTIFNQILLAESDEQIGAGAYERSNGRKDYRNGTRARTLTTRIGRIELEVPRHRNEPFSTVLFDKYQRNEQALILSMMEMVVQGVSTRSVQKVTEELCGEKFSKSMVSDLCRRLDGPVRAFRHRPLKARYPFIMIDAMYIKVRENHRVVSMALMVAVGISESGNQEIIGFDVCEKESLATCGAFLGSLKDRGLNGVDIIVSDSHKGIVEAVRELFPDTVWQRCQVHFTRNILGKVPKKYMTAVGDGLKSMFNASSIEEARRMRDSLVDEYKDVAAEAMKILDEGFEDAMAVATLPERFRRRLRTTNMIERENREVRRREQVIQIFPNIDSAIRLIGAVLMDDHEDWIGRQRIFNMAEYYAKREKLLTKMKAA